MTAELDIVEPIATVILVVEVVILASGVFSRYVVPFAQYERARNARPARRVTA